MRKPGSRTEPEFYKPVLRYFCPTSTEPELNRITEPNFQNLKERTGTEPNNLSAHEP